MDINTLIEQGKARIAERKLQEQLAHQERERWCPMVETEFGFIRVPPGGAEIEGAGTAPVQ